MTYVFSGTLNPTNSP